MSGVISATDMTVMWEMARFPLKCILNGTRFCSFFFYVLSEIVHVGTQLMSESTFCETIGCNMALPVYLIG